MASAALGVWSLHARRGPTNSRASRLSPRGPGLRYPSDARERWYLDDEDAAYRVVAIFFALTALQFEHLNQRALRWSLLATVALGVLVELEEGASRTGNCRLTAVLPDIAGALIAGAAVLGVTTMRDWRGRRANGARQLPNER